MRSVGIWRCGRVWCSFVKIDDDDVWWFPTLLLEIDGAECCAVLFFAVQCVLSGAEGTTDGLTVSWMIEMPNFFL